LAQQRRHHFSQLHHRLPEVCGSRTDTVLRTGVSVEDAAREAATANEPGTADVVASCSLSAGRAHAPG